MTDLTMGQRIAEQRKKLGISQEALGEKMGVSRQAISKWESDGAVPEIDKLIALSKLFGVSVGWLLGVEESPQPAETKQEISEELLRKIEEIVLRYRPRKEKLSAGKKAAIAAVTVLALVCLGAFLSKWSNQSQMLSFTYAQVENINEQNANIQAQLDALSRRMDTLPASAEPVKTLLASYSMDIVPLSGSEEPLAQIHFSAVPAAWQDGDMGILSIRRNGAETQREQCAWDGSFLSADVVLEIQDGYEYCFTLLHADGTQEQQTLPDYTGEHLAEAFTITAESPSPSFTYHDEVLTITNYEVDLRLPSMGQDLTWSQVDLVLYRDGEELTRHNLLDAATEEDPDILRSPTLWMGGRDVRFENVALPQHSDIQLWIYAEVSNGLSVINHVETWVANQDGSLGKQ